MRLTALIVTAVSGFVGFWLGFPSSVDPSGRNIAGFSDEISLVQANAEPAPDVSPKPAVDAKQEKKEEPAIEGCLPKSALDDLLKRRKELEVRESQLMARESELAAREKAAQDELQKIQSVRAEIEQVQGSRQKQDDEKIARIVEVLEAMTPKAASQLVATYEESLAVQAMSRMSTPKLSKILNLMEPKRSVRLMELMAGKGTPASGADSGAQNRNEVRK